MNITELPTEVMALPPEVVAIVTKRFAESEESTEVPESTCDLPEPVIEEILQLMEKHAKAFELPYLIRCLPADITQVEVATAVVELVGPSIRFLPDSQEWLVFDSASGWRRDPLCHQLNQLVVETLRVLEEYEPIGANTTENRRFTKARRSRARRMQNISVMKGIVNLDAMNSLVHCSSSDVDANPTVIGTLSGVVNLGAGECAPFELGELITRRVALEFVPEAQCPRWEKFLREVLGDDKEIQDYFHQLVGYILSGETSLQQMWLMVGSGSNGKSTLLHILQKLLGPDYAQQAPESVLLGRSNVGGATNDLVRLKGIRCALLTETGHGQYFNEERVKALVAADTIAARGLYREFEEFTPQAKFLLATNHLPLVRGTDKGIWRRLVVVPFTKEFEVGSDPTLYQDLVAELPGIFAWAVRGAVRWYDSSVPFTVPTAWDLATNQYRGEQDSLKGFLDHRVDIKPGLFVGATELYDAYVSWCRDDGRQALSQSEFGQRMTTTLDVTRGRKGKSNLHHYFGVALRCSAEAEVAAKLDGLFDDQSATPPCPELNSPDGPLMEVSR
jgi:putative DNA primase/helicase